MISVGIKPLLGRLNEYCRKKLEASAGMCVARSHYEITVEHVIWQMLEDSSCDFALILSHYSMDIRGLKSRLNNALEALSSGNSAKPVFSPRLIEWYQESQLAGSVELGEPRIRSGSLFLALLNPASQFAAPGVSEFFHITGKDDFLKHFSGMVQGSQEEPDVSQQSTEQSPAGQTALETYCEDFTEKARQGLIDPVFGRDHEIRQVVDIFARRRKNNPILVGEPGVGKTAVAEGLALRMVEGDVPDFLKNVRLLTLDMGLLQAGAGVKGEFENRLKKVIEDVKASQTPIILFIDEAHTLIGAGAAAGGSDAANLLKPALARGELRTIAATTWSEYKKYFEKDAALARRFQLVHLDEPSVESAILILRGLRTRYEKAHGVVIRDDAVTAAAELSSRYISGRYLPDKAIDLLDTSAARVKVLLTAKPGAVENIERQLQAAAREREALDRDRMFGVDVDKPRLQMLDTMMKEMERELAALMERWTKEKDLTSRLIDLRQSLYTLEPQEPPADNAPAPADNPAKKTKGRTKSADAEKETASAPNDPVAVLNQQIRDIQNELQDIQGKTPLVRFEVEPQVVARVVSDWTGIPAGQMMNDEARSVMDMEERLKTRVKGQDPAVSEICRIIRAAKAGLKDPAQPLGVFLLAGPSGVGKTETGLALAEFLFGGERFVVSVNMSEFQEKHTVSRLIGSPPGYLGYGEGGVLTEAVRQRPYSVVLLDEVEKAHPEVLNLFYQVFDKGVLSDGEGRIVSFRNTVIFLTSNLGTDAMGEAVTENPEIGTEDLATAIRPELTRHFKSALLARMNVIPYRALCADTLKDIAAAKLRRVTERMSDSHGVALSFETGVIEMIAGKCRDGDSGARNVDHILDRSLLPLLSGEILDRLAEGALPPRISVRVSQQGELEIAGGKRKSKKNVGS